MFISHQCFADSDFRSQFFYPLQASLIIYIILHSLSLPLCPQAEKWKNQLHYSLAPPPEFNLLDVRKLLHIFTWGGGGGKV